MSNKWYGSLQNRLAEGHQFCDTIKVGTGVTEYHVDMLLEGHCPRPDSKYSVIFGNSVIYFESLKWYNKLLIKLLGGKIKAL